jgi:hypothetical protein
VIAESPSGRLVRAPADVLTFGQGGAIRFETPAGALFGAEEGRWSLHLVWLREEIPSSTAIRTLDDLRGLPIHQRRTETITYRTRFGDNLGGGRER